MVPFLNRVSYFIQKFNIPYPGGVVSLLFGAPGGVWIQLPGGNPIHYGKSKITTWEHIRLCVIFHDGVGIVGFSKGMSPLTYVMDNNHLHQCLMFHICIFNVKPHIPYGNPRYPRQWGDRHS